MNFKRYDHPSSELFHKLNILPLNKLYKLNVSTLMHKTHNNQITGKYKITKIENVHTYNTRSAKNKNYYQPFNKLNLGKNSFTAQGIKIWNKLPVNLKTLPLYLFKKNLKQYLINSLSKQIT